MYIFLSLIILSWDKSEECNKANMPLFLNFQSPYDSIYAHNSIYTHNNPTNPLSIHPHVEIHSSVVKHIDQFNGKNTNMSLIATTTKFRCINKIQPETKIILQTLLTAHGFSVELYILIYIFSLIQHPYILFLLFKFIYIYGSLLRKNELLNNDI